MAFECPTGTRFQQRTMVCDHYNQVKCHLSADYYHANLRIGQKDLKFIDDGNQVTSHYRQITTISWGPVRSGPISDWT